MIDLGKHVRLIRQNMDLSQRELARRVGVSNGTISQIERGNSDPSFSLLMKVLGGLGVSASEFFDGGITLKQKIFFTQEDFIDVGAGNLQYMQFGPHMEGRAMQMLKEFYPVGASTGRKKITHEGEEAGVVISGRLEVRAGDEVRILKEGESYYFSSTIPHSFKNVGRVPCEVISCCTPPF